MTNIESFLKYMENYDKTKYKNIILSISNKISNKYGIIKAIENLYLNIDSVNTKKDYMDHKNKIFTYNSTIPSQISITCYKLVEIYESKLEEQYKKKFTNICSFFRHSYLKEFASDIKYNNPIIEIKNTKISLDLYLKIKNYLF